MPAPHAIAAMHSSLIFLLITSCFYPALGSLPGSLVHALYFKFRWLLFALTCQHPLSTHAAVVGRAAPLGLKHTTAGAQQHYASKSQYS